MCGIVGVLTPGIPVDKPRCALALRLLAHRGPDGEGTLSADTRTGAWSRRRGADAAQLWAGDAFLGHQRLAIIDLDELAGQPMQNEDGTCWVAFNGEIYNHRELRRRLVALGHTFRTDHSDTEVVVHGYEQWGASVLEQLDGMFAFGVLDLRNRRLVLARDPFGEKPLYYAKSNFGVMFASEAKALVRSRLVERSLDCAAVVDYLRLGYIPAPSTVFKGLSKLEAGTRLVADFTSTIRFRIDAYADRSPASRAHDVDSFHEALGQIVLSRLESDVPVGVFLSGGLDSSSIVRAVSRVAPDRPVQTFTIAFDHQTDDESALAGLVAKRYGTYHHVERVAAETLPRLVPELAQIFDEPFADSSALPTLVLSRLANKHVKVALSGDGGDERLGGYSRYRLNERVRQVFQGRMGAPFAVMSRTVAQVWPERVRGKRLLRLLHPVDSERYIRSISDDWLLEHSELAGTNGATDLAALWYSARQPSLLSTMMAFDQQLTLPDDLLTKVDRTSMSCGLEVRAPFLGRALPAPPRDTLSPGQGKEVLRGPLRQEVGVSVGSAAKRGFKLPIGDWFRSRLRCFASDALAQTDGLVRDLFGDIPQRLLADHVRGSRDQSHRLWTLLMLAMWDRENRARS
jgi:asparagine synthase (glutamine-hydrolysing)